MKKFTITALSLVIASGGLFAQQIATKAMVKTAAESKGVQENTAQNTRTNQAEAAFWSEDFSSGLPTGWQNVGATTNELWEYRGPSTTPSNTEGTRGAYGATGDPITSPTASNGFMIFDSDYLDNAGVQGNFGNGIAPSPHFATLVTNSIDLSAESSVELSFYQYYRRFAGPAGSQAVPATYVSFSTDGGTTWGNRITFNSTVAVNSATPTNDLAKANVSAIIGGQSNVKIRFEFDGDYYFWMIDDIELNPAPKYELQWSGFSGAPSKDMIFRGQSSGSSKMGHLVKNAGVDQLRTMEFDGNVYNYGSSPATNVKLNVDILAGGSLVTSYTSATAISLNPGDTGTYNDLNTYNNPYKPTAIGNYQAVYSITSDSAATIYDTINFFVTETALSSDFGSGDNSIGTTQLGDDGSALAVRHDLTMPVALEGIQIFISSATVAGATVEVGIYDTASFPTVETLIASGTSAYTVTAADIAAGSFIVPITDGTNPYAELSDAYFVKVTMYSNAGANLIRIWNDQTVPQIGRLMYNSDDATWYSGYSNSLTYNAPLIRSIVSTFGVGLEEETLKANVTVGPNPADEFVNVSFNELEGDYNMTMTDITGRVVSSESVHVFGATKHTLDVSSLAAGVYMLNVNNGSASVTYKISVQ